MGIAKRTPFGVVDTGIRGGRANIAFDQALIDAHRAGEIGDTVRFLTFRPSALVGRHQSLSREIRLAWCRDNGVEIVRRITGGGALYMDEGQFGLELVFHRRNLDLPTLGDVACGVCEAIALGLSKLGVPARWRPRNDIEVDGRKISGTGGFFDGDTLFYQATILVDMDPARMLKALNVPEAKLAKRALDDAGARITTLRALLGEAMPSTAAIRAALLEGLAERLGIDATPVAIDPRLEARAEALHREDIGTDDFVFEIDSPPDAAGHAVHTGPGGTIEAWVRREGPRDERIREVLITGDFFVTPPRTVLDLEAALRGTPVSEIRERVDAFFARAEIGILSANSSDFAVAIEEAAAQCG